MSWRHPQPLTKREAVLVGIAVWFYPVMEHYLVERVLSRSVLDTDYRRKRP